MRTRSGLIVVSLVVLLLAGAGAVYAYDTGRAARIAEGISIGGVDVGGFDEARARAELRAAVLGPLDRPLKVLHRGRRFTLTPEQAGVTIDVDGAIDGALAASRDGSIVARTWRALTGGRVRKDVALQVRYSREAVRSFVERVSRRVGRPAVDASLDLQAGKVDPAPSKVGLAVQASQLRRAVARELVDTGDRDTVSVPTRAARPRVTSAELAERYPAIIVIDRSAFKLTLYKRLKRANTYPVGVGRAGMETPAGLYDVQNKAVDPAWFVPNAAWAGELAGQVIAPDDPRNPIKARWLGIYDGAGIHGTTDVASIGNAESHGCIRMRISDVKELYDQVPVGAPVYIR